MSETAFRSILMAATVVETVDIDGLESETNPLHAATLVQPAHDPADAGCPLKITGEQTIRTANEMRVALARHLDRGLDVVLDLSEVDECDTAALQLIFALHRSAAQRKQRFHITAVSPAIAETAAALGLRIEDLAAASAPVVANGTGEMEESNRGI